MVGTERGGELALAGVLGPDDDRARRARPDDGVESGDRGQSEGSGADHGHNIAGGDTGGQDSVHGTRGRLNHYGVLVAERVRHGVELAGMGDEGSSRPAAAGIGAEPGLESGAERARSQIAAAAGVAGTALGAKRVDVSRRASEHRLDHRSGARLQGPPRVVHAAIVEDADHFMAGHEWKRHHVLEVPRSAPVQGGQVGTADARKEGAQRIPVVARAVWCVRVEQLQGSDARPTARAEDGGHP